MKKFIMFCLVLVMSFAVFAEAEAKGFSIALLDANNDNSWRIQMEAGIQNLIDQYKAEGLVSEYVAFSANNDATLQAQQLDQLVNKGVDCVLINPVSATSLNPIIDKAIDRKIVIIAIDSTIDHPDVITVTNDQFEYARIHVNWLIEQIGGKGDIIQFNAIKGVPANEERETVYNEVLAANADVKVLATEYHSWNVAKAKQIMASLITAYPEFDAVLTQECTHGIIAAIVEAGKPFPKAISGDESIEGLRTWGKYKYNSLMVGNPPGIGSDGLMVAIGLLQGRSLDTSKLDNGNIMRIPGTGLIITNEDRDEWIEKTKDMGDNEYIDYILTQDEVDAYFVD